MRIVIKQAFHDNPLLVEPGEMQIVEYHGMPDMIHVHCPCGKENCRIFIPVYSEGEDKPLGGRFNFLTMDKEGRPTLRDVVHNRPHELKRDTVVNAQVGGCGTKFRIVNGEIVTDVDLVDALCEEQI